MGHEGAGAGIGESEDWRGLRPSESPLTVIVADRSGRITTIEGPALARLEPRPRTGTTVAELAERIPVVAFGWREALAGRRSTAAWEGDGQRFELDFQPLLADDGGVVGCAVVVRDVSAEQLRRQRLGLMFRQIPGAVWATDRELRVTYVLGRLAGEIGIAHPPPPGTTMAEFLGTDDENDALLAQHRAAIAGEAGSCHYLFRGRLHEVHLRPLHDAYGEILGCVGVAIDVTERVRAEEQLARREAQLAEAQRVAHVGSWEWDPKRNVVTWTDELYRIYGLLPSQFDGSYEGFLARVHPDDLGHTKDIMFGAFRSGGSFVYDHRIIRPDGSVRMLHTRGELVYDEHHRPLRIVGCCWDITERWQAEQERERSVSLLRATLEATADAILVVDAAGRITRYNRRFGEMWAVSDELMARRDHAAVINAMVGQLDDPDGFWQRIRELAARPDSTSFDVLRFKNEHVVERYSRPQQLGSEIVGRVWSFRDVTEREHLLRRALFLADASRLLASLDAEKALEAVAHLAVPFLGIGCAIDLLGNGGPRRLLTISRDPGRPVTAELPRAVLGGHPLIYSIGSVSHLAVPLVARSGLLGALTFAAPEGRRYVQSDLDVAEELAHRAALAVENARIHEHAQEALRARDEFLAIAAHEIRGPVTAMHMAVQSLQDKRLPEDQRARVLSVIEREDRRLARFVDELLDIGRIRARRFHFDFEEVDLVEVTRHILSRFGAEIARSGSAISLTSGGQLVGVWDRSRLCQVVTNLLSNAIKFGLGKPIEIHVASQGDMAELVVTDHGIGIAPEQQRRVFKPFERAVSARHYGGLGLGLYIVQTIAEGLGGTVEVRSQLGAGSTFTVRLPQMRPT